VGASDVAGLLERSAASDLRREVRRREAEPYYERALQIAPDFAQAHNNLANLYAYRGNLAGAIEHYEKALALQPDLKEARDNLNAVRAQQGGRSDDPLSRDRQ